MVCVGRNSDAQNLHPVGGIAHLGVFPSRNSSLLVLSSHFLLILAASAAAVNFVSNCVYGIFLAG